jgi:DNA-binding response OmpR family regulator
MASKGKVLIIEDDRYILKMYQLKLSLEGFDVQVAENGKLGVDKVKEFMPDIILLDILMPELDGFQVLEIIKGEATTKDIPVLIMSNLGQEDHIDKGMKLGAMGYVVKSQFSPSQVVEKVKEVVGAKVD